jgi:hypothetical protein
MGMVALLSAENESDGVGEGDGFEFDVVEFLPVFWSFWRLAD